MHQSTGNPPGTTPRLNRELLILVGGLIATSHATNMMIIPSLPRFVDMVLGGAFVIVGFALGTTSTARFLMNIPAGMLADRFGRRYVLLIGIIGVGTASSLSGTASEVPLFLVYRFFTGLFSAMTITIGNVVITDLSTVENRGRVLGLMHGIQLIAGLATPGLGGVLAELIDIRAPFLASGIGALAFGVWALVRLPETRPRGGAHGAHAQAAPRGALSRGALLRDSNFVLVALLGYATFFTRTGATLALMPLFAETVVGLSPGQLGILFSISSGLHSGLVYPAGVVADRLGRKAVIVPAGLLSIVGFAAVPFAETPLLFILAFFFLHAAQGWGGQAPVAYLGDIAPPGARGLAMGMYRTAGDFAGVIAPVTTTALAQGVSFHAAFFLNAALWAAALLLFWRFAQETAGRNRVARRADHGTPEEQRDPRGGRSH